MHDRDGNRECGVNQNGHGNFNTNAEKTFNIYIKKIGWRANDATNTIFPLPKDINFALQSEL